jgi:tetratricopeptide (TPR) repeat protein
MRNNEPATPSQFLAKPGIMEVLVCAITAFTYFGTLSFGFVYDDNATIVSNVAIRSFRTVPQQFQSSAFLHIYRPLTALWLCANYALFGLRPAWWHLAAVALHVLITYLTFVVTYELVSDRGTAFIASLLFGIHPAHVENVTWLSAVNDLLMSALLLASFLAFLHYRKSDGKSRLVLSLVLFAAALLTKETAVVFPVLILVFAWLFTAETGGAWRRAANSIGASVAFFCVLAVYLIARSFAMMGSVGASTTSLPGWTTIALTWPSILWFDVCHLVLPLRLSEFYPSGYVASPGLKTFIVPAALLTAVTISVLLWTRRLKDAHAAQFAFAWIWLTLVPALYLRALTPSDFLHDRFLYLPSFGFVILVALAIRQLPGSLTEPSSSPMRLAVVVLLVVAGVVGTFSNQLPWASDVLLYENGLKFVPDSSNLKDNLANALVARGQSQEAIRLYQEVLERDPRFWRSNYNLGHELLRAGKNAEAEQYLTRAVQIDGSDADQFIFLAVAQWRQNKLADAVRNGELAIARSPQSPGFHYILGMILNAGGNRDQAISEFKQEIANHPENMAARDQIQKLQLSK